MVVAIFADIIACFTKDISMTESFIAKNKERMLKELTELLSIPSISTEPSNAADVQRCAEWIADHCRAIGMTETRIYPTPGHPIVYAEWLGAGADAPTVLFYGHYDVQPVDPLHLWTNPPFEPVFRDGKVFARGATDDKGQVFLHLKALEALFAERGSLPVNVKLLIEGEEEIGSPNLEPFMNEYREMLRCDTVLISDTPIFAPGLPSLVYGLRGSLPVNVKLLIEGEEEIGSPNLEPFMNEYREMLRCDTVLISDTPIFAPGLPSLVYGLRGLCYMEVEFTGPNRDLHSGTFGGAVHNPINALAETIARLKDGFGRITIPGFYGDVVPLTQEEREDFARLPYNDQAYCDELDISSTYGEFGYSTYERTGARPTLDVNGIWGGFIGEGAKTVLPSKATAKISMRLVPHQKTDTIAALFEEHIRTIAPPTMKVKVTNLHGADPALTPRDSDGVKAAVKALEYAYNAKPVLSREGGSIPVCLLFDTILNAPTVLMGFGLNTENAHSPDEHFSLENFEKGIIATSVFYDEFLSIARGA